jgi:hypothetical protein
MLNMLSGRYVQAIMAVLPEENDRSLVAGHLSLDKFPFPPQRQTTFPSTSLNNLFLHNVKQPFH